MGAMQHRTRSLESVRDFVDEALENLVLERLSSTGEEPAMALARDVLLAGGKRYRPVLALLAHEAAGGTDLEGIVDMAIAVELIHTATLVHDDINDQSRTRRGRPAIHATHGISHGVIAGDYLFVLAFERCGAYEARIIERIAASCIRVASGELLQLKHIGDLGTKPEDYYDIIDGKTAGSFATICSCAAIFAGSSEDYITPMESYGKELGRAFQLVDDLLDLTGDPSMGKPRGTDVQEGKMTLPIIHALTVLYGVEREQLADVLTNFGDDRLQELIELLEKAGSFDYSRQLISNHVERALGHLHQMPASNARDLMVDIAKMSQTRTT